MLRLFSPYGVVLRAPGARGAFAASLAGRLCYGIVSLSLVLTLTAGGRGYGLAGLVMGVLVSPALVTAYVLAGSLAAASARTRAGNWVSGGFNGGSSAGSALAGQLAGRFPLSACLPVLAGPALLAVVPLLRARLAPPAEQWSACGGHAAGPAPPRAGTLDGGR